jgi:hypothetical protein
MFTVLLFHSSFLLNPFLLYRYGVAVVSDGRTPWTSDQLVARPLPKHRTTQTQNKHIHIPNIHALCGIRTHDPGFRASENSTCLRPLAYRDRPFFIYLNIILLYVLLVWPLGRLSL